MSSDFCIVVACNDTEILNRNLMRSPMVADGSVPVHVEHDAPSAAIAYNRGLEATGAAFVIFAHQDVYFPHGWQERLAQAIKTLDRDAPQWALVAPFGMSLAGEHIGTVWSTSLGAVVGRPVDGPEPAQSFDELVIVMKRAAGLTFDEQMPSFHLFGTDIVQTALDAGKGAFVASLPLVHNDRFHPQLGADFAAGFQHCRRKWRNRLPLDTSVIRITKSGLALPYYRLRAWRSLAKRRRIAGDDRMDPRIYAQHAGMEDPAPGPTGAPPAGAAEVTVVVVSYNTREMTLRCLETLYSATHETAFETIVIDNLSQDGSADAVAAAFPQVTLVRNDANVGFAAANNQAAELASTEWLLLLNSDTEVLEGAVDRLMDFGRANPGGCIYGGRTFFADLSLNAASCWNRITPWSMVCSVMGLNSVFPHSRLFNPEGIGGWRRDTVARVDVVVGCFFLIRRALWQRLGGFDLRYFMYGEEADLCLRAARLGCTPMVTPEANIIHHGGASNSNAAEKIVLVAKARMTLIRDHWPAYQVPLGIGLFWLWGGARRAAAEVLAAVSPSSGRPRRQVWVQVWKDRRNWLRGYTRPGER